MNAAICRLGGLTAIVVLIAVLPGEQRALLLFGALATAWQPLQTVLADRRPEGTTFTHPLIRTILRTLALAAGSVALVIGMQAVVGRVDLFALVSTAPRHGTRLTLPNVPQLIPIAALEFVTFLQLVMTCEGRPFTRLPRRWTGWAALAAATVITVPSYRLLVNWNAVPSATRAAMGLIDPRGPIPAADLPVWLIVVAAWQVISRNLLHGWPGTALPAAAGRIAVNNLVVLAAGTLTYLALSAASLTPATIAALGGAQSPAGALSATSSLAIESRDRPVRAAATGRRTRSGSRPPQPAPPACTSFSALPPRSGLSIASRPACGSLSSPSASSPGESPGRPASSPMDPTSRP